MQQGRKTGRWGGCLRGAGGVSGLDQRPGTIKPETRDLQRVSVGKCLRLHDCFFQIGGWCMVSSRKISMLLHFV